MKPILALLALAAAVQAAPPEPKFRAVTIDDEIQIGYGVAVADVDGDKHPDILLADKKQFVWYRNPGPAKPNATPPAPAPWDKFILAENLTEKDNVCLAAQDIDGDGKCEIAVGAEWNPGDTVNSGAVFYLIPPTDRTQKWEAVNFPNVEPTTHRMKWVQTGGKVWGLVVCPLHGRGNKNGEGTPVKVLLYRKPAGNPNGDWKTEVIDESMHMTHNFDVPKRTGGITSSILLAGKEWIRSPMKDGSQWTLSFIVANGESASGAGEVREGQIMTSGEANSSRTWKSFIATIEPMHGNQLAVYMPPNKTETEWQRHLLTDKLIEGHALACGDLLGVGGDQIVVGWRGSPGKEGSPTGVAVWTPLDDQGGKWRETMIDRDGMACEDLVLADLNGDGKLDIVASGRATKNVKIYFNETPR